MEVYVISLEIRTAVCVFVCACVSYLCDVLLYFCLKTKQTKKTVTSCSQRILLRTLPFLGVCVQVAIHILVVHHISMTEHTQT